MKKNYTKVDHELKRMSHNFKRGDVGATEQRKELVKTLSAEQARENAVQIAETLYEAFGKEYTIEKNEGIRTYHIARKDVALQLKWHPLIPVEWKTVLGEGQIVVTVTHDGKFNIRVNPSADGNTHYHAEKLSHNDLLAEMKMLQSFMSDGRFSSSASKLVLESELWDFSEDDLNELLESYQ